MQTGKSKQSVLSRLLAREAAANRSLTTAIYFVIAYVVLWIASFTFVSVLRGETNGSPSAATMVYGALLSGIVTSIGVIQWARRRLGAVWYEQLRLQAARGLPLAAIFIFSLGCAWAIDLIGFLLKLKSGQFTAPLFGVLLGPVSLPWIAAALVAVAIQPAAESLVFSGILYPALAQQFKDNRVTILVTAVITTITALLIAVRQESWYALIQPFFMGLIVIGVRAYTQSTRSALVARVAFGLFFVLAALFSIGLPI